MPRLRVKKDGKYLGQVGEGAIPSSQTLKKKKINAVNPRIKKKKGKYSQKESRRKDK